MKKSDFAPITVMLLGLVILASWFYLKPADCSTFEGLQHALVQNFFTVNDVTEQVKQEKAKNMNDYLKFYTNQNYPDLSDYKVYENEHYLDVNGVQLDVIIAKPETLNFILKEKIEKASRCDRIYAALLFNKGNLILSSADMNKRLTKTLKSLYGESLVD